MIPKILFDKTKGIVEENSIPVDATEDGRSRTIFYYCSENHQSGLQSNTFSKLSSCFFNTSQCAANYVISFELYDDFIGQKTFNEHTLVNFRLPWWMH